MSTHGSDDETDSIDDSLSVESNDDDDVDQLIESNEYIDDISRNHLHTKIVIIPADERITLNRMTEYELTEAICIRATQLERRPIALTNVEGINDASAMACKEIDDGKCPLVLRRCVGKRVVEGELVAYYEYWDVNTMSKPVIKD